MLAPRDLLRRATGSARSSTPTRSSTQGSYSGLRDNKDKDSTLLTGLLVPVTLERLTEHARAA